MRKEIAFALVVCVVLVVALTAHADKPVDPETGIPFGNGFPSGPHYNLNIIGKRGNFTCPEPSFDDQQQQVFGNVIFIPREQGGDPITILMESGRKGPKGAQATAELQVTDWCTESFPDYGENQGDGAALRLPKNDNGYAVYARLTGKPGEGGEPTVSISPDLYYVEDEAGNDLILLGLVDPSGVFAWNGATLVRTDPASKGKGVQKATDITPLFLWSGWVCYVQSDWDIYCLDDQGNNTCSPLDLCCVDAETLLPDGTTVPGPDGIYERCDLCADVGTAVDTTCTCPEFDVDGIPYIPVTAQCQTYEEEWVFNIADFVGYLWDLDTTGSYVIQVRFYPL